MSQAKHNQVTNQYNEIFGFDCQRPIKHMFEEIRLKLVLCSFGTLTIALGHFLSMNYLQMASILSMVALFLAKNKSMQKLTISSASRFKLQVETILLLLVVYIHMEVLQIRPYQFESQCLVMSLLESKRCK